MLKSMVKTHNKNSYSEKVMIMKNTCSLHWSTIVLLSLPLALIMTTALLYFLVFVLRIDAASAAPASATPLAPVQTNWIDQPMRALNCGVTPTDSAETLVRSAPAERFAPFGTLSEGASLMVLGQTTTQPVWYAVGYAERRGWVAATAGRLVGECAALPNVRNPLIPDAPMDIAAFVIEVDRDGGAVFREALSTPTGDGEDLVWVRLINLYSQPPDNFRVLTMTVRCRNATDDSGGIDALRWGLANNPTLGCGDSFTFPFIHGDSDRPLLIRLPSSNHQAYLEYELVIQQGDTIAAPALQSGA